MSDPDHLLGAAGGRLASREPNLAWKDDWARARRALTGWWEGRGPAIHVTAPLDTPREDAVPPPPVAPDLETRWLDPAHRLASNLSRMSHTFYGGVAFPVFDADVGGPGSLGLFLGAQGHLAPDTVWYSPCISDPDSCPAIRLNMECDWWRRHAAAIATGVEFARGRYLVGFPDLIENIDTLAQLRDPQLLLMDMVERPGWVESAVEQINLAYFACFDAIRAHVADETGGNAWNAFALWGPGRTAKVQCDFSCMISPAMFRRFVAPALERQCRWLDYAMYHLDGTQAIPQLDNLLGIEALRAIEWTPQAGLPGGGSPRWFDLYRRIRSAGKSVQAVGVAYDEVEPLLDAVGADGVFIMTSAPTEADARRLLDRVGWAG